MTARQRAVAGTCANCGAPAPEEFCGHCGQRRAARMTLARVWRDSLLRLSEFDFAFVHTFADLSVRPGTMVKAYLGGRTRPYTPPFKYAFIIVTAYVVTLALLDIDVRLPGAPITSERDLAALAVITRLTAYLFFPAAAAVALVQWGVSRRYGFNYAESLVFVTYAFGHLHVLNIVVGATLGFNNLAGVLCLFAGELAYLVWAQWQLQSASVRRALIGGTSLALANFIAFNLIALALANLLGLLGVV